jgi:hypothetical protein
MKHNVGTAILTELSRAEISIKTRQNKKTENLLELLSNDDLDVHFNGYPSLSSYKQSLLRLYENFKAEMAELVNDCKETFLERLKQIKSKLSELTIMLNPNDQDILLAHVVFKRNPRFVTEDYQLSMIKKKY